MTEQPPFFQSVFAADWAKLAPIFHRHYANRPYSSDVSVAEGSLTIEASFLMRLILPLMRLTRTLVPFTGKDIPTTVYFRSEPHAPGFILDRLIQPPGRKPVRFTSRMIQIKQNHLVEQTASGLSWAFTCGLENNKIYLKHEGYVIRLGQRFFKLPLEWLIGSGNASETAIDDHHFAMTMAITHRLFGKLYSYHGTFVMKQ